MTSSAPVWLADYQRAVANVGLFDFRRRTQIRVTGKDRRTLLHNLCTNKVLNLSAGHGCEAFLTNVQAKVLAHVFIFVQEEALILESVADQADAILAHLDRYTIREDAVATNVSSARQQWLVTGEKTPGLLASQLGVEPPDIMLHAPATIAGIAVELRRHPWLGANSFSLDVASDDSPALLQKLVDWFGPVCDPSAAEAMRIEAGMPAYGFDITPDNLAQEVARDKTAISFTKGCYLGQETIARIDALGHVNRSLRQVVFQNDEIPQPGLELSSGADIVGKITSASYSPRFGKPIALAYIKRGFENAGTLESALGTASVVRHD